MLSNPLIMIISSAITIDNVQGTQIFSNSFKKSIKSKGKD